MTNSIPAGQRLIGKWYYGLGDGQYVRYQFTDKGAYAYSSPFKMFEGRFEIDGNQLTLTPSGGEAESYTIEFECIGSGSFSEYLTLRSNITGLDTPYNRDPGDPNQFCK